MHSERAHSSVLLPAFPIALRVEITARCAGPRPIPRLIMEQIKLFALSAKMASSKNSLIQAHVICNAILPASPALELLTPANSVR